MNRLIVSHIVVTIAMTALMCVVAHREELYSDQYDYVDIRIVLTNDTIRTQFYNCFMEIGPCTTPEQVFITGIFSEAYQTHCRKCTEKQKELVWQVNNWYEKNQPDTWQLIVAKTVEDMKKKNAYQYPSSTIFWHNIGYKLFSKIWFALGK